MSLSIRSENLSALFGSPAGSIAGREILKGEIDGMETRLYAVLPGQTLTLAPRADTGLAYLCTAGNGVLRTSGRRCEISEISLFSPVHGEPATVTTADATLEMLELAVALSKEDLREFDANKDKYPYFVSYSQCSTYKEKIKSPKTISRTLMPEHTFPRLCVGSVETTGDDHVAAHVHAMLEQLFYGLKGNKVLVHADGTTTEFGERVLLHVPLGSSHSVDVVAPDKLHYIWIDLFRDRQGMDWITREHKPEPRRAS